MRAAGSRAGRIITEPHDRVGGVLDIAYPVMVLDGLVAGDVEHPRTASPDRGGNAGGVEATVNGRSVRASFFP
jgi:hypothetical protein